MLASGVGFTAYLTFAKTASAEMHPVVLGFFRSFIGLLVVSPILLRRGVGFLATPKFPTLLTRSLFGTFGFILSLIAVSDAFGLPLADFNALSFTRPLFVTILAAIVLNEIVGPRRWGAVGIGFLGVLIMAVPGTIFFWLPGDSALSSGLDLASILAVSSAFFFAGAIILVKSLSSVHSPLQLIVWANLLSTALLLPGAIWFWSWPSFQTTLEIVILSVAGLAAQYAYVRAMSVGDASFLSPMDYLRLPMAAVVDFALFKLLPGPFVWLGAAIIVSATLYITFRESRSRSA